MTINNLFPEFSTSTTATGIMWGVWVQSEGTPTRFVSRVPGLSQLTVGVINLKQRPCIISRIQAKPKRVQDAEAVVFAGKDHRPHVWSGRLGVVRGLPPGATPKITSFGRSIANLKKHCTMSVNLEYRYSVPHSTWLEHDLELEGAER